jgi:alpha-beta hydrolase superfamily lysophospholipase
MAEFILVHGAWHGAWCWREVVPRLEARGHMANAIDLPGHGADRSPLDTVSLQDYVSASSRPSTTRRIVRY